MIILGRLLIGFMVLTQKSSYVNINNGSTPYAMGTAELWVVCDENVNEERLTCRINNTRGPYYAHGTLSWGPQHSG
jgi:hypothetical protein